MTEQLSLHFNRQENGLPWFSSFLSEVHLTRYKEAAKKEKALHSMSTAVCNQHLSNQSVLQEEVACWKVFGRFTGPEFQLSPGLSYVTASRYLPSLGSYQCYIRWHCPFCFSCQPLLCIQDHRERPYACMIFAVCSQLYLQMCWLFSVFFRFAFLPVEGACSLYSDQSLPALVVSNGATSHTHLSWIVYPHLSVGSFHLDIQTLFQIEFTNHPHLTSPQISISLWHPTAVLLPRKSHGWRNLVGCSPWGREESGTTERLHSHFPLSCIGEGNGNPLQCSCLENPRDVW